MLFLVKSITKEDGIVTDVSIEGIFKNESKALDLVEMLTSYQQSHYKSSNTIIELDEVESDLC